MHELGIANSLLQLAREEAQRHPGARIRRLRVRIGELSGVNADALSFGFEVLARDSGLTGLTLDIEYAPRQQHCPACDHTFVVRDYDITCPACGAAETKFASGDELEVVSLEMDDDRSTVTTQSA